MNNPYLQTTNYPGFSAMDFADGVPIKMVVPGWYNADVQEAENGAKTVLEKAPDYIARFQDFYSRNIVLISVIQWVFLLILLIKISKK